MQVPPFWQGREKHSLISRKIQNVCPLTASRLKDGRKSNKRILPYPKIVTENNSTSSSSLSYPPVSHFVPVYPGRHKHLYHNAPLPLARPPSPLPPLPRAVGSTSSHVPPFWHGFTRHSLIPGKNYCVQIGIVLAHDVLLLLPPLLCEKHHFAPYTTSYHGMPSLQKDIFICISTDST